MNILLVYKEADIATYKMLEGLSKLEDFNIYIASPQSYTDKKIYGNCTPLDLPVITSKFNWNVIRALRKIIKTYRIDLIYSPSSSGLSNALFASIGTRAKNIAYRGTQAKLKRFDPTYYLGILNPAVEHVVCETKDIEEYLSRFIARKRLTTSTKPFVQGLEVTIRLYNRQLQTGKMIDLLDISAQSEGCGTEKKYRLADYFNRWWDEYAKHPAEYITPEQYKAANAIRVCRTAALGIDTYACPECGEVREIYHSCKNRFCPTCGWRDTLKWAARMKDKLLRVPHRHVVMTLPHVLLDLVKRNKKEMLNIMMRTSAEALKIWMMKAFGLKVGVIAVLHTYGETKQYHVHTHMILSWGGIDGNGRIVVPEKSKVNDAFIRSIFKHTFDKALIELFDNRKLKHDFRNRMEFMSFIKHVVNKKQWIVHLEPPLEMPEQVIQYIGRYSKRACLSEYKITAMEDENITFRYRDYQNSPDRRNPLEKELTLHYREFFPRLMQHVPLHYFRIVRYYGFYSNKGNLPGEYFGRDENVMQNAPAEESDYENPFFCECCQRARIYVHTIITRRTVFDESTETLVFSRSDIRKQKVA